MKSKTYVALIRGINVGGNNIVRMEALRSACESVGLRNVVTFIQSGNVVFESDDRSEKSLEKMLEELLEERFLMKTMVVVIGAEAYREIVAHFPKAFDRDSDDWKHDVFFCGSEKEASALAEEFDGKDEGFEVSSFGRAVYWSRRRGHKGADKCIRKLLAHKLYKRMTIRNDRTARKLLALL